MLSRVMQGRATRWTLLVVLLLAAGAGTFYAYPIALQHECRRWCAARAAHEFDQRGLVVGDQR